MGMIDPVGVLGSPRNDGQKYLISTPAGGRFLVEYFELSLTFRRNANPALPHFGLCGLFAKRVGDNEVRLHFIPIDMCDISPYSESASEIEPVGCATVEKKQSGGDTLESGLPDGVV